MYYSLCRMNTSRGPKRHADQEVPLVTKRPKLDDLNQHLSPLERLPREIVWEIVANSSDSILKLRLVRYPT